MKIEVMPLVSSDRADWQCLYEAYFEFYQMQSSAEKLDAVWSWIFASDHRFYALIARNEAGEALGLMHYREMVSPLRGCMIGFLDDLFVVPSARGQGTVDALFTALGDEAKLHGWPMVRWVTAEDNYRGRGYYDKIAEKIPFLTYQMNTV